MIRKIANTNLHEGGGVADGFDVFFIVAGVPPTAGGVDIGNFAGDEGRNGRNVVDVVVHVEGRGLVNVGVFILKMAGSGAEGVGDVVGAIAFGFVEEESVEEKAGVEIFGSVDGEFIGSSGDGARDLDLVEIAAGDGEVDGVDRISDFVAVGPCAKECADVAGGGDFVFGVEDSESFSGDDSGRHEIGTIRSGSGFVAGLIDAHVDGLGMRGAAGDEQRKKSENNKTGVGAHKNL